ncbi:MAG: polysaccharide biosynthesis protein [Clostridia bacterium]|nr:polysaccharide biosynthesis protein [Clostridia bacterium]
MSRLKVTRRTYLFCIDFAIALASYLLVLSFGAVFGEDTLTPYGHAVCFSVFALCAFISRFIFKTYRNVWRYANSTNYIKIVVSDMLGGACFVLITALDVFVGCRIGLWRSISLVLIFDVVTLTSRFAYQMLYRHLKISDAESDKEKIRVAIVGAGQVGNLLADELKYNVRSKYTPIFFIDKDKNKIGGKVAGLPVFAENDDVLDKIKSFEIKQIFIAVPKIDNECANKILHFYSQTGCKVKIYDVPIQSTKGAKSVIRDVKIEDLLFRSSQDVLNDETRSYYKDRVVMVTGGGGSIGSELCRKIASCAPKKLIIFDIYENNAYDIQQELIRKYGAELDLCVEIGSVRDRARLNAVFAHYRPEIVLHAAAHKHVPLMEHSNCEAIKNNVLGTYNTADMAEKYGVEKFILISTDKAVNPTNVMGASKRLCEMVVQCRTDSATKFAAVRFGNVLGSNGSVIPLFKQQIESGGPLTVTDKRIIRYFMTIPEASGLVMQAGAMAKRGELFVLDMGNPVKIIDLAENMIKLSGLTPYRDIDIVEIGLRPGEKLYEELLIKTENLTKTDNNMIFIEHDTPFTREEMEEKLDILRDAVRDAEDEVAAASIKAAMKSVVPTFYEPEDINRVAEQCDEMKKVATR